MSIEPNTLSADRELEQRIVASLQNHHVPSLHKVQVEVHQGVVTLRGEVNSFYAKQLTQHSARRVAGDSRVIDELSVVTPAGFRDPLRLSLSAAAGAALILLLLVSGCSQAEPEKLPVFPVTGQVIYEGRPAAGAWVVLHPADPQRAWPQPRAKTDSQGNFTLSTYDPQDGAPAGDYLVTLELPQVINRGGELETGGNLLPPQYSAPETTSIATRVAEGPNTLPIQIVR
jgi:hypothetical protein